MPLFTQIFFGMLGIIFARSISSRMKVYSRTSLFATVSTYQIKIEEKLSKLRETMEKEGLDAFIVPSDDPHMSEYTAPFFNRREFISGFTGSAGTAVITRHNAYLWTDGRFIKTFLIQM